MSPFLLIWLLAWQSPAEVQPPTNDPALLREQLLDSKNPGVQSQAALLLVQQPGSEAEELVRQGLRQIDKNELFNALTSALRTQRDRRFLDELLSSLVAGSPSIRQMSASALADLADDRIMLKLQSLAEDDSADKQIRQLALWTLGQSGRRNAVIVLLDQLSSPEEAIRGAAAEALGELTGRPYGLSVTRWKQWWELHKDLNEERWLTERLSYQASRARRLEGDLERARGQVVALHQQLFARLPAADRLGLIQQAAGSDDPAIRQLAIGWSAEAWATLDVTGQRTLSDALYRLSYDGTIEVQRQAVLALGRSSEPKTFDRLRQLLLKGHTSVRAAAARVLAQQARGSGAEALSRQRKAVVALQKALDDPALEVVIEAAESLGTFGLPEASPLLAALLKHPSPTVRQTAALALERVAELGVLDGVLAALDDPAVNVRFSLVGAIGHAVGDGRSLTEARRVQILERLEGILLRDADPGVRSRAATVLGECGSIATLPTLWRRLLASEEARVQDKAWLAMIEIMVRCGNLELVHEWDRLLTEAKQPARRLQLLHELASRWQKREDQKGSYPMVQEMLAQANVEQGKWIVAFPVVRELLAKPCSELELERRLRWLLIIGEQALKEGNRVEALRAVQEAQPHIARKVSLAESFEKLEKQAKLP